MGLRVTQRMLVDRVLSNLNRQTRKILGLQEQLATGLRVNRPSDDPIDARRAIDLRTTIGKNEQFLDNIRTAGPHLTESATTIQGVIDVLQRVRELTIQGANGSQSQTQRTQISNEVNQLLETVLESGNHVTNNRYIFAGTRTLTPAFEETRDANGEIVSVTYAGNGERIKIAVSDGQTTGINETGDAVFQASQDIFQLLIDIRDNLRGGDTNALGNQRLDELDTAQDQLLLSLSRIGSIQNRIERRDADIEEFNVQMQKVRSEAIEADFAEVVVNLNAQSNAFQAALGATARVIQPSLLDFIR